MVSKGDISWFNLMVNVMVNIWMYPNAWMVFVRENPTKLWKMTGGSPILGSLHMSILVLMGKP